MENSFFTELLLVLIIAAFVAILFERIRLPSILGFLLAGVVIGPYGFALLTDTTHIHELAEFGVVLLMLTIGLEFSFDRLKGMKKLAILGGALQIFISLGVSIAFALLIGWSLYDGFFLGSVIALSSTAIVFKYLIDRGEIDTPHGRIAVSILIFQDIAFVPLMIFISTVGVPAGSFLQIFGMAFLKTIVLIAGAIVFSKYLLPWMLQKVKMSKNREIFFLASIVICLATAWISGKLGLSMAIGAFLAGLMFANTGLSHQLIGDIVPFRHIFVSIFFVSIGLLFNVGFAAENFLLIISVVSLVLFVNFVIMTFLIMGFGFPPRIALMTGIILSQIGEFSFLLINTAKATGGINEYLYQILLSTAFLTMLITPALFALIPLILKLSEKIPMLGFPLWGGQKIEISETHLKDHVILCGYGPSGRDLATAFQDEKIPFILLEMNPSNVQSAKEKNINVIYGDAANREVMKCAGIELARAVVVSFPDPIGIGQIIRVVESLNPDVMLAVRTRHEKEMPRLYSMGADIVIMEEWEASYELNRAVLEHFEISKERIKHHLERIQTRKEFAIEQAIFKNMIPIPKEK